MVRISKPQKKFYHRTNKYTNLEDLPKIIENELKNYSYEVTENVKNAVDVTMKELVENTKKDARVGRRKGKYKKSISSKTIVNKELEKRKVWYVKAPEYRLAHLLNNGHAKKGVGFVAGDNHITKNEKIAVKELEERIKGAIENGS